MAEDKRPLADRRCTAMIAAGIYNPNSKDGIDFCVNYCPYEYCVVVESKETVAQLKKRQRADFARQLRKHRVSVDDIALMLDVNQRTVLRWLRK